MSHEFTLKVSRSEGIWSVAIRDERGEGVRAMDSKGLTTAFLDAFSFIASRFPPEREESVGPPWGDPLETGP